MNKLLSALAVSATLSLCGIAAYAPALGQDAAPASPAFYDAKIKPVFAANCYKCHTEKMSGGLRLDSREAILKGGDSGPAIVVGAPEKSLLVTAVHQTDPDMKMPPKGAKLSDAEIADIEAWIKAGAVWSAAAAASPAPGALAENPKPEAPTPPAAAPQAPPSPLDTVAAEHAKLVPAAAQNSDFFENKVRPILANSCYSCHTDGAAANLHVDSRAALLKGGDSGPVIVPGDPANSLMIKAVEQTGHLKMPKGGKLTPAEVETLTVWVKMGAPWSAAPPAAAAPLRAGDTLTPKQREFWSFQPLRLPEEPKVKDAHWAKTPIDRFVLASLESQGLAPAAPADRHTLIRRATLDLIGVPPTPEEVDAYEKDKSPNAFARVVDRLLASPHYGEHWGRHWLDVARYADDDVRGLDPKGRGYMPFRGAWVYRDWVIKAINTDVPYDQFVKMQLAGDFLAKDVKDPKSDAYHDDLAATAYIGDGPWLWDQAEPIQGRADERAERVDAVSRGLMGLTVGCARCHNHKYDPISQKDYYSMVGLFASSTYKEYPTVSAPEVAVYQERFHTYVELQQEQEDFLKQENKSLANALSYQTAKYMVGAWQVSGKPKMKVVEAADKDSLDPQVLERWVDYLKVPAKYPYLKDWQAMVAAGGTEDQAKALAEIFQKTVLRVAAEQREIEKDNEEIRIKAGSEKRSEFVDTTPDKFTTFDQFCPGCALEVKSLPEAEVQLYNGLFVGSVPEDSSSKFKPGVFSFRGWELKRRLSPQWQEYLAELDKQIEAAKKGLPPYPFVNGVADLPQPVDVKLNIRGNPHSLGDPVPRKFLTVLSKPDEKPFQKGSGRLEFADTLIANPIFARVFVNRVWKWHFGSGIVNTPDDFGIRGDAPSNPALLEYLAEDFVQKKMSLKALQREIMLSAVYQEGDEESPAAHEKDAANRFYSHFSRQRMDAETLRDSVLFVAGDLDTKDEGGPPAELKLDTTRRTVYLKVSRFHLSQYLEVFDFPNPGFSADQRFSSNVPLQRLYFMNDPFVYDQAGKLADRLFPLPNDEARIRQAYLLLYGRTPLPKELELGEAFLKNTPEKPGYAVDGEPITAWKQYARILLSSNEFEFIN
jgi:mono/diheme cytochrome c family protein